MEKLILSAILASRESYETFEAIGDKSTLSPVGALIYGNIDEYYRLDKDARSIDSDFIKAKVIRGVKNDKHVAGISQYFADLPRDVSYVNVAREIRAIHKQSIGGKLSLCLANGSPEEEVQKLIASYNEAPSEACAAGETSVVDVLDTTDLTDDTKSDACYIQLWPRSLNDRIDGGCLRGHHILVFARPEIGKTLFAINLCAGFLFQKLRVLYVGNEEPMPDIRDRIRGRLLKMSRSSVRANRAGVAARLDAALLGTVHIVGDATAFSDVRRALGHNNYDVVIIDQIRNMRVKSDSRTAELEAAGIEARSIAKQFAVLVVSITQAGDSATNKVYLDMSDVDSSKTGIPASADLMIGIGGDSSMVSNGLLGISLCKNKLSGEHARFTVSANFQTGVIS